MFRGKYRYEVLRYLGCIALGCLTLKKFQNEDDDENEEKGPAPPPVLNFADIECSLTEDRGSRPWKTLQKWKGMRGHAVITFFHNMRGFDGNFILEALYKQGCAVEKPLTQGAKILYFESGNLIFKDSMNFFAMALDKFPSTFHLQELHTGFFPHAFNQECNFNYSGEYPTIADYNPDDMDTKKREQFLTWHAQKVAENAVFNFQEVLLKYCESDVKLLKEGCLVFVKEFEEIAGFNHLVESVTIASACNLFWRKEKLEQDLIGQI